MSTQALAVLLTASALADPTRASLQVDASALGETGTFVAERIAARGELVLRDGDVLPASRPEDPLITIRIDSLADVEGYRVSYVVTAAGEMVEGTRGSAECRLCTEAELSEQVDAAIARLVLRLEPAKEEPPAPEVTPPVAAPAPPPARGWTVGPMGGAGIALTAVGGLALGLGVGFVVAEPVLLGGNAERNSTLAVSGWGVAVGGLTLAGTGIALMLIERARSRKRGQTARYGGGLRF
ncbi:MAG: hypothetical protein AAGA54_20290 [Myxococcota bacterium]